MKKWNAAAIEELNIAETAHGWMDSFVELSKDGCGFNNDLADGQDSDGDGFPKGGKPESGTPDTRS